MENIKLIKSEEEYQSALKEMSKIFQAKPGTPEGDRLELLALVIEDYEAKNYKIEPLSPLDALKCEMEEKGLSQSGLAQLLGMNKSTISEVLSGKKPMSLRFLKHLHKDLGIPAEILLS